MGFFDKAFNVLTSAAAGFVVGGPGGALAGGLGSLTGTPAAASTSVVGGVSAGVITPAVVTALAVQSPQEIARAAAAGGALQPTGMMKNMVQTIVQTIAPNGAIVRATILKGRPYLMNSDFVVLKRTLKLIGIAEERVPRPRTRGQKAAKQQAHTKGILEGMAAASGNTAAALIHHSDD